MRLIGYIGTAVLSLTLVAPAFAQQEQHDEKEKPAQESEKKAQPEKPAKQEEKNAQQQDKNKQQEQKNAQQQDRNNKQEDKNAQQQHSQPAQRASRIPDDRYKANFGSEHRFRVTQSNYSSGRFQYGGYWFGFGGAWPSNWLYTQDVYVIEIDGMYYLCNPMYPGVNLAINVTL